MKKGLLFYLLCQIAFNSFGQKYSWTNKTNKKVRVDFVYDRPVEPGVVLAKEFNPGESLNFYNLLGSVTQAHVSHGGLWEGKYVILFMGTCATCKTPGNYNILDAVQPPRPVPIPPMPPHTPPLDATVYPGEILAFSCSFNKLYESQVIILDGNNKFVFDCKSAASKNGCDFRWICPVENDKQPLKILVKYNHPYYGWVLGQYNSKDTVTYSAENRRMVDVKYPNTRVKIGILNYQRDKQKK